MVCETARRAETEARSSEEGRDENNSKNILEEEDQASPDYG